ncbi:Ig-like domain-containing protein [Pseudomonas citronellolis]|uniref:Ig-like domain-containing protein n=1 Tax=Pseudomonas citronellolis TaxID=53408 RepID=UPI002D76A5BD|nr:Ig-like domain-containing protein [Pseudomonas citronellolis]WRT82513.1 Ig-like domain-containing protein [Pseudomonas citronellolis]
MNFAFIDKQNTLYFFPADELESASLPIQAMDGARYILTEQEGDEVTHSVAAERVGNDLHLRLLNEQQTPSAIVLQDFYLSRGSIHGLTDSGEYRLHLSADDSAAQGPVAWASESLGMQQDQADAPFLSLIQREVTVQALQQLAESLAPSEEQAQGEAQAMPTLLMADTPEEASNLAGQPAIGGLYDQVGSKQGLINGSNVTDDKNPKLEGTGEPGSTLEIWLNGEEILGTVVVDEQGQWSFTPKAPLDDGGHIFYVRDPATDTRSGNVAVIIDTVAPNRAEISSIADDRSGTGVVIANNGHTGDNTPLLSGKAEPNSMVAIYIGGKYFLSVQSDNAGHWSFLPPEGFEFKDGRYDFSVAAVDFAGNIGLRSPTYSITIDTLAPNVPTIGSVHDDVGNVTGELVPGAATDDTLPTLSGQAEPGVTVIIRDNGEKIGEVQADENGNWTFTPEQPLAEGEHGFTVEALDAGGNRSGQSPAWNLVIDTTAPEQPGIDGEGPGISEVIDDVGTIQGPIEKGATTDDATPTFNGTGEPGDTIIVRDGEQEIGRVVVDENGNWTFTPEEPLAEGDHAINVIIQDPAGNQSEPSDAWELTVDTLTPNVPTIDGVYDDVGVVTGELVPGAATDDTQPTLKGQAEAGATIVVRDNGQKIGETLADAEGNWSFTPEQPLAEGEHSFTVEAMGSTGNPSAPSSAWELVIDTTAPTKPGTDGEGPGIGEIIDDQGPIQGPIEKGDVTDDSTPTLGGTGEPGDTVIIRDGEEEIGRVEIGDDGTWSFTPDEPLGEGEHDINVIIQDPAGNQSDPSDPWVVVVDTQAPDAPTIGGVYDDVGNVTGALASGDSTDDTQPTFSGQAEAGAIVSIFDGEQKLGEVVADENGSWNFTPEEPLGEGEHSFTVRAQDAAGNLSEPSAAWEMVVDTSAPDQPGIDGEGPGISGVIDDQGPIQGPIENGGITDDATPTFNGTGEPGDTIIVRDGEQEIGRVVVDENGNWSFTPEEPLGDGDHAINVIIQDKAGNPSDPSDPWVVTVDTQAPDVPSIGGVYDDVGNVTGALASGDSTDDTQPTFSGQAEAGAIVSIYDGEQKLGEVLADENGNWSFTPEEPLTEGEHSFTVRAQDAAGNLSEPSAAWEMVIDTSAPDQPGIDGEGPGIGEIIDDQGPIQGPIENGGITDDTTPTFNGTGEPGDTIIVRDGEQEIGRIVVDDNGNWSFTPDEPLGEGEHAINVIIQDKAGNQSDPSDPWVVTVDTQAPDVPSIGGVYDDVGNVTGTLASGDSTDDTQPTFSGQAEAGSIVSIYDGEQKLGEVEADENGNWSFTPEEPLTEGEHSFTVRAQDAAGNLSEPSAPWEVVIDTTAPTKPGTDGEGLGISGVIDDQGPIQGPIENGGITDDTTPTFNGTGEPGDTIIIRDGEQEIGRVEIGEDGTWSFTPDEPLGEGEHAINVIIQDKAGNQSEPSDPWVVTVDTQSPDAPSIGGVFDDAGAVTGELASGDVTDDAQPTFSGQAEAGSIVSIYDGEQKLGEVVADENGSWSFAPEEPLAEGGHSFTVRAQDAAGNLSEPSASWDLVIDTQAPDAPSIGGVFDDVGEVTGALASGDATDDQRPTLSGQAEAGSIVSIFDGEQKLGEVLADENGSWTFTPEEPLADGQHSFTVKAVDAAGNVSDASAAWLTTIVTQAPEQPSIESVTDDVGPLTGALHSGDLTDDSRPQISGRSEPGNTVRIYDRGVEIGSVQADDQGNWSFTPESELADGEYSFTAVAENAAGTRSPASEAFELIVYTGNGPTQVARLSHMGKDSGQDGNDFVTDNGTYGRLMYGALSAELNAGQTLQVSTDGGRTWFDALVDGTNWAVQDRSAHSGSWTIQTRVVDQAGNPGYVMQQAVVLDTVAPRAPSSIQLDGTHLLVGFDPANVAVGDRIAVIADGGIQRFEHTLTQADIAAGSVTLEVGSIGSASAALVDQAGNLSGFANTDAAPSVNYLLSGDVTEIYGQGRDNVFSVANVCVLEQIKVIEGNAGVDTLKLTGADQVLDLSALQGRLSSIEVIDLTGTGDNTLKVSLGDVLDLGNQRSFINDDNVQLAVKGNAGDVVMLSDLLPNGMDVGDWENLGQVTAAGIVYEVYQHTGLEAEILVQQGVTVQTL